MDVATEEQEQMLVAQWLDAIRVVWAHVPNSGYRAILRAQAAKVLGARLKKMGVKKGFPDILIFTPPPSRPEFTGMAIEMKRTKRGKLSDDQRRWLASLSECGWYSAVCYGATEAIELLRTFGYGE